ncbi:MAG: hypothetical protein K6U14_04965 [Firmicutes bacterium]|nr:hypothetical protein [Alicyclobacillaceae bacterium]MCL6496972.1 hypothetical protein [Bacillota bacterium]
MRGWERTPTALWLGIALCGAGSYWLPRPWCLLAALAGMGWAWGWTRWQGVFEAVAWARRLRHRTANQLQVVAGWLELGQAGRAEAALAGVNRCLAEETGRWSGLDPLRAYVLLEVEHWAEARGVRCRWEGRLGPELSWWGLMWLRYAVARVLPVAGETLDVRVAPDGGGFLVCWQGSLPPPRLFGGFKSLAHEDTMCLGWGRWPKLPVAATTIEPGGDPAAEAGNGPR